MLRTLGAAGLYAPGEATPLLGPGKPLALLAYLAITPGRRASRDFLVDFLWADLEPERARSALRQVLFHLRRLLGDAALPGTEELTLTIPIEIDRDQFLLAIEAGELDTAVVRYTGSFLPSFGVPGGAAFEQWADLERDRLRAAFLRCAEILVRRLLNQSRFRDAQRLAQRARDEAPDAEAAWRLLLEAVVAARDFVSAAVEAEALEAWAATEVLGLEPATRAAIARARQVSPTVDAVQDEGLLVAELTGREREFSVITAAWDAARVGPARHVHLTAPSGFGKTRLLRDAVARLRAAGASVVVTQGAPGDRDIPYAFAGDLAMAIAELPGATGIAPASAAALLALNPTLSGRLAGTPDPAAGDDAVRHRVQALADLVHAVADEQPFVVVIDDLHWVDGSSYRLLEGLWGRLGGAPLLCLSAGRPERPLAEAALTVLPLAPLTPSQVGSLIAALGTLPAGASWSEGLVPGLHVATGGSPLLVLETLRLAIDKGVLVLEGGEWACLDEIGLESLLRAGEALRQRVLALPWEEAWALALLATAGTPLSQEELARTIEATPAELTERLAALERHGMVTRSGPAWQPAHDEIAAAGREALEPDQRTAAERVVGQLLVETAESDSYRLLRGVRHLVAAGAAEEVQRHFRRYVQRLRGQRDRRPLVQLAAEVLGESARSPGARALAATLPRRWHYGLWSPGRERLAAVAGLIGLTAIALVRATGTPHESFPRLMYADSTRTVRAIQVDADAWDGRDTPLLPRRSRSDFLDAALAFPERAPALSPDGRSMAWNQHAGDSTTLDIWTRTPGGTRRLTRQARDDLVTSWLPDGSGLVGLTNRWSDPAMGNYDIAIFDTATGEARQVTSGPDHDGTPFVSPDGARIAFVRESDEAPPQVCLVTFDGLGAPDCRLPGGHPVAQLLGWSSATELVLTLERDRARPLVRYDWLRNEQTLVLGSHTYRAVLSPDRRWVAAAVRIDGIRGSRDWIIPIRQPTRARRVDGERRATAVRWWEGSSDPADLVDRVVLTDTSHVLLLGVGTRLAIRALTKAGIEAVVRAPVRWRASDTLVASVDSTGEVRPRSRGTVIIEGSLAGWRVTRGRFEVRGDPATTVLEESWNDQWPSRWIAFGDPRPVVVRGPGGAPAFWNRGDGNYSSMVVLRRGFSAAQGLGAEVRLSTPLGRSSWQRARTLLVAGVDTAAFQDADPLKAPPSPGRSDAICGANYPGGSGRYGRGRLDLFGGITQGLSLGPLAETLASGAWWTLRIQILPDGRCGVAINGQVLWLSPEPIPLDGEFRLRLGDESAGTRLLHGPLQVWTGVRTDINWSRPPR